MKRLFIIIALTVSSFFLFDQKVEATEFSFDLDFSLINEDFYKAKEAADNFVKEDTTFSDYYFIAVEDNDMYVSFLPLDFSKFKFQVSGSSYYFITGSGGYSRYKYSFSDSSLTASGSFSSNYLEPYVKIQILYSNYEFVFSYDTSHIITYNYDGWSTTDNFVKGEVVNTLYINYLEYQSTLGNPEHDKELETISNFYSVVIDKLSYLAEKVAESYILLAIIVIFILIFVFKLIFRRHL